MDNILSFPTKLDKLAEKIKHDIAVRSASQEAWAAATLDLCLDLAEARAEFSANSDFGRWLEDNQIELSHQDRAAAIAMGQDPKRAAEVLTVTERRSLRHIFAQEFHLTHVGKTPEPETKARKESDERAKAFAAYDAIKASGAPLTQSAVRKAANVGHTVVRAVFTTREAEQRAEAARQKAGAEAKTQAPIDTSILSASQQAKFEALERRLRAQLAAEFDAAVAAKSQQWCEDIGLTAHRKEMDALTDMLNNPRFSVMRKAEYNAILMCLHPDRLKAVTEAQLAEAFRIFTHYKLKLINDEEERIEARRKLRSNLPDTLAEMLARKTTGRKP